MDDSGNSGVGNNREGNRGRPGAKQARIYFAPGPGRSIRSRNTYFFPFFITLLRAALAFSRFAPRSIREAISFLASAYFFDIKDWLLGILNCLRYWAGFN